MCTQANPPNSLLSNVKKGRGLLNSIINKLPVELHIPGYNYCGPGTKLHKRLLRGDRGVNDLDDACKQHDIAYSNNNNLIDRHKADELLAEEAIKRFKSKDASVGEKLSALGVAGAMKTKLKMGMGSKPNQNLKTKKKGGALSFNDVVKRARKSISSSNDLNKAAKIAFRTVSKIKRRVNKPRVITIPKKGGFLPLVPIFAGLSALGALSGGAAGIAKAVNDAKAAAEQLKEQQRHNKTMEAAIAMGEGLYLKSHKKGLGLYLRSQKKKKNFH